MNASVFNATPNQNREVFTNKAKSVNSSSKSEAPEMLSKEFDDHMKADSKVEDKVQSKPATVPAKNEKLEPRKSESQKDSAQDKKADNPEELISTEGLDRDQVKKIEKTVRKLLLESIHLSPEKFSELTSRVEEGIELEEGMREILDKVENLLAKLKELAGKSTGELRTQVVTDADKIISGFKKIISIDSHETGQLEKELKNLLGSKEVENFLDKKPIKYQLVNETLQKVEVEPKEKIEIPLKDIKPGSATASANNVIKESIDPSVGPLKKGVKTSVNQFISKEAPKETKEVPITSKEVKQAIKESSSKLDIDVAKDTKPTNENPLIKGKENKVSNNGLKLVSKSEQALPKNVEPKQTKESEVFMKSIKKVTVESKDEPALVKDFFKKDDFKNNLNKPNANNMRNSLAANNKALSQEPLQDQGQQNNKGESGSKDLLSENKSLNFLKKLKNILKKSEPSEGNFSEQLQNKSVQKNKLNFVNKMNASTLVKQLIDKIDKFVKSTQSSATIELQTPGLGEMKVAAEVVGSKLSLNISSLSQSIRAELIHMRSELNQNLKALGFEDVELGFDFADQENSSKNPFEDQIEEKRQKDPVKLPGDYLADLAEISNWLKSFNAS